VKATWRYRPDNRGGAVIFMPAALADRRVSAPSGAFPTSSTKDRWAQPFVLHSLSSNKVGIKGLTHEESKHKGT